ncbi:sphingosine/diacylglycerol kinase-like enzyme [Opitutaceae bacterium TAV1]|nr:sphingosine/diacylglycerol kinase-like enzyme [Opitutaceae bacterium TAV1]
MRTCLILNPCSGRNRRRPWLASTLRAFAAGQGATLDAAVSVTEGPGHATLLAREAVEAGCELVVSVGGDGTLNEVAQALVGTPATLGIVPCGSGNGLARHLGVPGSLPAALELIAEGGADVRRVGGRGEPRRVSLDVGEANGLPFFNAMGFGLDAEVSRHFNAMTRRGLPAYVRTAFTVVRRMRRERISILEAGTGRQTDLEVVLLVVANSDQYGNNAFIAPHARVDDGRLDLIAVEPCGLAGATSLALRLFLGSIDRARNVRRMAGERFLIRRTAADIIHTDGETRATDATLEISVRPRSLRVLVPPASRVRSPAAETAGAGMPAIAPAPGFSSSQP